MNSLRFILSVERGERLRIVLLAAVSGLANAVMLVVVNSVAGAVAGEEKLTWSQFAIYALAYPVFLWSAKRALLKANLIVEELLRDLRLRLAEQLRRAELLTIQRQVRGRLYATIAHETNHLSMLFPVLVNLLGQLFGLAACLLYIGYLSKAALVLVFLTFAGGVITVGRLSSSLQADQHRVVETQARLGEALSHLVDGFKELAINTKKRQAVLGEFSELSDQSQQAQKKVADFAVNFSLLSTTTLYIMLGAIAFIFPQYLESHSVVVFKLTAAVLFCVGPVMSIIGLFPAAMQAEVGLATIYGLEERLLQCQGVEPSEARRQATRYTELHEIGYRQLTFAHRDLTGQPVFEVGPLDLELRPGEIVFLVGGNGSGKTTTVRLLSGLYPAESGAILVNGEPVGVTELAGFREMFSTVLADFHLFERLYGLEQVEPERVQELIRMVELEGKVEFRDGAFSNLNLSTGQRKRLALITALLEDRRVYVFDEWAADQDAHFRERFYTEILPDLAKRGKAVLVVSHDERYWSRADRVIKIDLGTVEWEQVASEG